MSLTVPTSLLTPERAHEVAVGALAAARVLGTVFPPRTEDADGTLALTSVEVIANQVMRTEVAARPSAQARRWWLEGFAVGFAVEAVDVLGTAAAYCSYSVPERLDDMAAHVLERLAPDQVAASDLVFAVCHAVHGDDPVGLAWALENLWRPFDTDARERPEELAERYKRVLVGAINTACASWRLLLLLRETADQ